MYDLLIPVSWIHKAKQHKVDRVKWYIHCGDHIMARDADGKYITLYTFDAFNLKYLEQYSIWVDMHNTNLAIGYTDDQHNEMIAKAIKQKSS